MLPINRGYRQQKDAAGKRSAALSITKALNKCFQMQRLNSGNRYGEPEPGFYTGTVHTTAAMCQLQLPPGSLGVFWGSAQGCQGPQRLLYCIPRCSCHGISIVALPAAMNVCMFPAERDPAEGGVISLTNTARTHAQAHTGKRPRRHLKTHTCTLVVCNYQLFTPDSVINIQPERFVSLCV